MRQIAIFVSVLLAITIVAAIWFGPALIDWDRYRDAIADRMQARTGLAISIDGPVSLSLVPRPRARLEGVVIDTGDGGPRIDVAEVDATLDPVALLTGRLAPVEMRLIAPRVDMTGDGDRTRGRSALERLTAMVDVLPNGRIVISRGELHAGARFALTELDATIATTGVGGSRRASASALAEGVPMTLDARLGGRRAAARPFRLDLGLPAASATLSYEGRAELDGQPGARGRLIAGGPDLGVLTSLVARATGRDAAHIPLVPSGFSVVGTLDADGAGFSLNDIEARVGGSQATGALSVIWDGEPRADLALAWGRMQLDRAPVGEVASLLRLLGSTRLAGSLDLEIEAARIGERVLRSAGLSAGRGESDGSWQVTRLGAELPGGGALTLAGEAALAADGVPRFDGRVSGRSDNLRLLLTWLGVEPTGIAPDRLRRLEIAADLSLDAQRVAARHIGATLDGSRIQGALTVAWAPDWRLSGGLRADRVNLDAYLPATARLDEGDTVRFALSGVEGRLDLELASAVWRNRALDDLRMTVTLDGGEAVMRELSGARR